MFWLFIVQFLTNLVNLKTTLLYHKYPLLTRKPNIKTQSLNDLGFLKANRVLLVIDKIFDLGLSLQISHVLLTFSIELFSH